MKPAKSERGRRREPAASTIVALPGVNTGGLEYSQEPYPQPCCKPVGRWMRHVQGIGGGASVGGACEARRCNCHRHSYVKALKVGPAIIKHKHDSGPKGGNRNVHAEAVDDAIGLMRPAHSGPCDGRATRVEGALGRERAEVAGSVRKATVELRSNPAHGDVGHDAAIPAAHWS